MKRVINQIPEELLENLKYYIRSNVKLSDKDIKELRKFYPNSYRKNILVYRIIGTNHGEDIPKIDVERDKSWTTDIKYKFQQYLEAADVYYRFQARISGFDFKDFLNDCKYHQEYDIKDLARFAREKEIYAMELKEFDLLDVLTDEPLENIIHQKPINLSKIVMTSDGIML